MLTILNDPAGITGRRRIAWGPGTVFEQIAAAMPEGGGDCAVRFNGEAIDPVTDPRMAAAPREDDEVVVVQRPEGVETWILIASLALAAYTYTLIPKPTDQPTQSTSPNNSLTGQTNIARAYQAVPDVYGLRRCWPDLIQPSTVEYVGNVKLVTEWLCVSRGKGTISDVQYAETPIDDIAGATFEVFEPSASPNTYPEDNDTTLSDVYEAFEAPDVNGQELADAPASIICFGPVDAGTPTIFNTAANTFTVFTADLPALDYLKSIAGSGSAAVTVPGSLSSAEPIDGTYPFLSYTVDGPNVYLVFDYGASFTGGAEYAAEWTTITPSGGGTARGPFTLPRECNQIWFNVAFLRGLVGSVTINAEWWRIDSSGAEVPGSREDNNFNFSANSYDQQFFTTKITPAAGLGRYRIQFSRVTADLGNGADVCKLEEVYAVRYYATKTLPGVTVVRVTTQATAQAIGFQDRKFNLRWLRHVRTLSSTTLSASRNFARALAHLWCIAGNDIAELDTAALAAINASLGEDGDLARFDWSFDDANLSLGERMQIIANVARCVIWRDGTQWTATRDQARTTPELQLDYRNLAAGGESAISYAAHLPASEDGVEVEYIDETTQATKAYVRFDISSGGVVSGTSANPRKIKLVGCATLAQALNRAHLEARKLLYQRTSVSDTALADAASLGPGSLVRWIDPCDFYGDAGLQGGEVLSIDGSTIQTSEALQWGAETTGRMLLTGTDGAPLGAPVVVTPAAGGAVLGSVPGGLYVRDDTRQLGSRYAFGPGLTAAEIEAAGLFTVTEIRPASDRTVALSLVNYDARIYAADNVLPVGVATETDSAFALGSNTAPAGLARETDRALALAAVQIRAVGRADETDTAVAL